MPTLDDIWAEIDCTDQDWLDDIPDGDATSVAADSTTQFTASTTQRALVQQMGESYGCHTCNTTLAGGAQWFIVDHIPPRGMFREGRGRFEYNFLPHCDACASQQATLVRSLVSGTHGAAKPARKALLAWRGRRKKVFLDEVRKALKDCGLTRKEIALLTGGEGQPSMPGHGNNPTRHDSQTLNSWATRCHSCLDRQASHYYHADHCPPKEFAMSGWFGAFIKAQPDSPLKTDILEALTESYFRPQCPGCSHRQGGRVNKIVVTATKETVSTGLTRKTRAGRKVRLRKYGR